MAFFDGLRPKQFTYLGFSLAALGAILCVASMLSIYNILGLRALPWLLLAVAAIASLAGATYCFHRMGEKKVEL